MIDPIERADALAAIALGDTVNQLQKKIRAIPRSDLCVTQADLEAARAELARVTAERDEGRAYALALVQEMKDRAQKEARETKLANAYIERLQSLVNKKDAETENTQAALAHLLHDLDELAANSEGVAGLHMNGEVADWESLFPGGTFGAWLAGVEVARAALQSTPAQKEQSE